jgi:hypothetical protein
MSRDESRQQSPEFEFPEVPSAYRPSGRTTPLGIALLVAATPVLGVAAGLAVLLWDQLVSAFVNAGLAIGELAGYMAIIGGVAFWVVGAVAIGYSLGLALDRVGRWGKNRNSRVQAGVACVTALVAAAMLYQGRVNALEGEAFDSWIDWAKWAIYSLIVLTVAVVIAAGRVSERPFCEACGVHMKRVPFDEYPIDREAEIVSALSAGDVWNLPVGQTLDDTASRCILTLDYCPRCQARGYLTCTTELRQTTQDGDGKPSRKRRSRRVAAAPAEPEQIHALTDA